MGDKEPTHGTSTAYSEQAVLLGQMFLEFDFVAAGDFSRQTVGFHVGNGNYRKLQPFGGV